MSTRWFRLFDAFSTARDLAGLRAQISPAVIDLQDEWGMAAVHSTVMMDWPAGLDAVLAGKPDLSLHYFRTGANALHMAVMEKRPSMVAALVAAGANPDLGNYGGVTPRMQAPELFATVPARDVTLPPPRIQNAEHLADHHHPRFKIPSRDERESLQVGQAVDVHVYGARPPKVKVRITRRGAEHGDIVYTARVETADSNLAPGTETVTLGPEHIATVYLVRPAV